MWPCHNMTKLLPASQRSNTLIYWMWATGKSWRYAIRKRSDLLNHTIKKGSREYRRRLSTTDIKHLSKQNLYTAHNITKLDVAQYNKRSSDLLFLAVVTASHCYETASANKKRFMLQLTAALIISISLHNLQINTFVNARLWSVLWCPVCRKTSVWFYVGLLGELK